MTPAWTDDDIPSQSGRIALVTGATGGLGLQVARVLAAKGATVIVAARDARRGAAARDVVAGVAREGAPELLMLDVSDLASVRAAVAHVAERHPRLDLLVNNAGVMAPPRSFSPDGVELQWTTNVTGPAALTWLLLPALEAAGRSRVVWVTSDRHRSARLDADLIAAGVRGDDYRGFDFYGRTKLAGLLLSHQLQRHFDAVGVSTLSAAAHPGFTDTGIVGAGFAGLPRWAHRVATAASGVLGQPVERGALPILYAATAPDVRGDDYFGPQGFLELRGNPGPATRSALSRSGALAEEVAKQVAAVTGVTPPGTT